MKNNLSQDESRKNDAMRKIADMYKKSILLRTANKYTFEGR